MRLSLCVTSDTKQSTTIPFRCISTIKLATWTLSQLYNLLSIFTIYTLFTKKLFYPICRQGFPERQVVETDKQIFFKRAKSVDVDRELSTSLVQIEFNVLIHTQHRGLLAFQLLECSAIVTSL